jgi:hypothetical protein
LITDPPRTGARPARCTAWTALTLAALMEVAACEGPQQVVVPTGYRPIGDGRLLGLQARMGTLDQVARAEVVEQSSSAVVVRVTLQLGDQPSRVQLTRESLVVLTAPLAGRTVSDAAGPTLPLVSALPSPSASSNAP